MPTLHIEHSISDFATWKVAFDSFADVRERSGVRRQQVQRRVDDPTYVVIDLSFDSTPEAQAFLGFLQANVWSSRANAPALVGTPHAQVLEPAESDISTKPAPGSAESGGVGGQVLEKQARDVVGRLVEHPV